jgi:hypothetical protein
LATPGSMDHETRLLHTLGQLFFAALRLCVILGFLRWSKQTIARKGGRVGERADTLRCDPLSPHRTGQADFPASGSPENSHPKAFASSGSLLGPRTSLCLG